MGLNSLQQKNIHFENNTQFSAKEAKRDQQPGSLNLKFITEKSVVRKVNNISDSSLR